MTRQLAANIFWGSAAVILCAAVYFYHSYSTDSRALRKLAMQLTEGMTRAYDRLQALNAFVHRRGGFASNESYSGMPRPFTSSIACSSVGFFWVRPSTVTTSPCFIE